MHADELEIDEALVRRLLAEQFPDWSDLPLRRVEPAGTVNAIFRLGAGLSVRLARREGPTEPGGKELEFRHWLARFDGDAAAVTNVWEGARSTPPWDC